MGSSRKGMEFRYRFRVDDEGGSRFYKWNFEKSEEEDDTRFVFETRTNFIVKGKFGDGADEKILESEKYTVALWENCDEEREGLEDNIGRRLEDYWMSDDEIRELVDGALDFARRSRADPRRASGDVVLIVIDLDVCTVQQGGEPIDAAVERAIRATYMFPVELCPWYLFARPLEMVKARRRDPDFFLETDFGYFLRDGLCAIRVEDVDEGLSARMEECSICLRSATVGAQISQLRCGHVFHHHCIVWWLMRNNSCPLCRQQAHDFRFEDMVVDIASLFS